MKTPFLKKIRRWRQQALIWSKPQQEKILAWCRPRAKQIQLWWLPQQEKLRVWAAPRLEQVQSRWASLAEREKSTILAGACCAAILLFYALIWSPLNNHLENLRVQIRAEKKTAAWIEMADEQIRSLENKHSTASTRTLSKRLNLVEEEIRQAPLNRQLTLLTQKSADEIHCAFNSVDFDTLIAWVMEFSQQHDLTVKQAVIRRLNNVGLAQAEFDFKVAG